MRNLNRLLAWAHARVLENCAEAISDQFGHARVLEQALLSRGRHVMLAQRPRHGPEALGKVAKLHFRITRPVASG